MARPGVNYQDIVNAIHELKGQNKNITIENIRAHLGTGSIGTINKYLREWRKIETSIGPIASKEYLPEELVSLMKGLWEGVLTQSLQRFEPIEANYQKELVDLKAELEKYQYNNQRWQKLFNQWQHEKTQLANEKLTLDQALEFAHKENQSLQVKNDSLLQQLQEKQERIGELNRLHQQTQTNLEHYREAAREQRLLDQQQFEREKQQLQLEIKNMQEQLIVKQTQYLDVSQQNKLLQQSYVELEKKQGEIVSSFESSKNKIIQLEKSNSEYQLTSHHWQKQCQELEKKIESKTSEIITLQSENKILNQQLIANKESLRDAQAQSKLLASEKWELIQEKARLEGQLKQIQKSFVT